MIAVDTDVLCYALIRGERTDSALLLREIDSDWKAPHLWRAEFVSVVNKYLKSRRITMVQAQETLEAAEHVFGGIDMAVDLPTVLSLAASTGASTYDAHFLALAQRCGVPLITGERRHPGAPQGLAMNIDDFLKLKK